MSTEYAVRAQAQSVCERYNFAVHLFGGVFDLPFFGGDEAFDHAVLEAVKKSLGDSAECQLLDGAIRVRPLDTEPQTALN